MTTLLLRASRALMLPGQQIKMIARLAQASKAVADFLKSATTGRKERLDLDRLESLKRQNLSFAADSYLEQQRHHTSIL